MEETINKTINEFITGKNLSFQIDRDYKKVILRTKDITIDVELLKEILLNTKIMKKEGYDNDYFYYITPSFKLYISENIHDNNDVDLNFTYLLNKYKENNLAIYKFSSIFQELVKDKKLNVKETIFTKYNSDEIKIFTKFLIYCINKTEIVDFNNFLYIKYFDSDKLKDVIKKNEFPKLETKILKLIENFGEILEIFDEIYDTKLFSDLDGDIIEYDKILNNKLFITEKENKFKIQIFIKKDNYKNIVELIKKIKNVFKDIELILYVDESIDDFYLLLKEDFINNLIINNAGNKNLLMLKNNKDLFIYYDLEIDSSYQIVEKQFNDIKRILPDYFETFYLVFNKQYKIHKVKITLDLSNFGYFIKDKVFQNYFRLSEYNEEKNHYSIYLYSKKNRLCYDIFCLVNPDITKILTLWLNYGNKKIIDNQDSLILINGYELMLKSSKLLQKIYYDKIILQVDNDNYKEEFNDALNKKNIEFHTKNIYCVNSLKDFMDENKNIPTTTLKVYNKRGFDTLLPFFNFVFKKKPILNKKPILLQVSYFLSYNLNVYGNNNALDK